MAEYLELGDTGYRTELVEGQLMVAPRLVPKHMEASHVLLTAIRAALPHGYRALQESGVLLVAEVISPGSGRMDRRIKREEYADAGIPHYWIVDLSDPVSMRECHPAGELGYADDGEVTGMFRATEPFPFELDLSGLIYD